MRPKSGGNVDRISIGVGLGGDPPGEEGRVVQLDLVPLVSAALKETARLTAAVEGLARELDHLTAELREGEIRDTNRRAGWRG